VLNGTERVDELTSHIRMRPATPFLLVVWL
jgi:hypothetical protein